MATMTKLRGYRGPALFSTASRPVLRAQDVRKGDDRWQSLPVDHELFRRCDRVAGRRGGVDGGRLRLSVGGPRLAGHPRPGAHDLHRLAQHGDVRGAAAVRSRSGVRAIVCRELGLAGLRFAHGRPDHAAVGLSGARRPPAALAMAPSGRGRPARRRFRSDRGRPCAYRLARPLDRAVPRASYSSVSHRSARPPAWARRSP